MFEESSGVANSAHDTAAADYDVVDLPAWLVDAKQPLSLQEDKRFPQLYEEVRSRLGLDRSTDLWAATKRFAPTKGAVGRLREIVRLELPEFQKIAGEPGNLYLLMPLSEDVPGFPAGQAERERKRLREIQERFTLATDWGALPPLVGWDREVPAYQPMLNELFLQLYTPWIATFLFSAVQRVLFGRLAPDTPAELRQFMFAQAGSPDWRTDFPADSRVSRETSYFSQCVWLSIVDVRLHDKEASFLGQVDERIRLLWDLRTYANSIDFRLNPSISHGLVRERDLDLMRAFILLGTKEVFDDRSKTDSLFDAVLRARPRQKEEEFRKAFIPAIRRTVPIERIFTSKKADWFRRYQPAKALELWAEAEMRFGALVNKYPSSSSASFPTWLAGTLGKLRVGGRRSKHADREVSNLVAQFEEDDEIPIDEQGGNYSARVMGGEDFLGEGSRRMSCITAETECVRQEALGDVKRAVESGLTKDERIVILTFCNIRESNPMLHDKDVVKETGRILDMDLNRVRGLRRSAQDTMLYKIGRSTFAAAGTTIPKRRRRGEK